MKELFTDILVSLFVAGIFMLIIGVPFLVIAGVL